MAIYDKDSFTVVPAAAGFQENSSGLVAPTVPVIYVSVDEPRPHSPAANGRNRLRAAAKALHRMADKVDSVRRTLERATDGAYS